MTPSGNAELEGISLLVGGASAGRSAVKRDLHALLSDRDVDRADLASLLTTTLTASRAPFGHRPSGRFAP